MTLICQAEGEGGGGLAGVSAPPVILSKAKNPPFLLPCSCPIHRAGYLVIPTKTGIQWLLLAYHPDRSGGNYFVKIDVNSLTFQSGIVKPIFK